MSKCVLCFYPVASDAVMLYCDNPKCAHERKVDAVATEYLGKDPGAGGDVTIGYSVVERRPPGVREWQPTNRFCKKCGSGLLRMCVRCHTPLPEVVLNSDVTAVAFAGPRSSGKTVAMKVGLSPLYNMIVGMGGALALMPALGTVKITDQDLKSQALPATERRVPWTLVFSLGQIAGRSRILAIRDIAGEDLAAADAPGKFDYFEYADLIVFLFDPFEVPQVRHALEDILPAQEIIGADTTQVFTNLLGLIGRGSPRLAIVVSKFDVLHELSTVDANVAAPFHNPGAGYMRSRPDGPTYDEVLGALISEEVRSLLAMLDAQGLVNLAEHPPTVTPAETRFFAMSALGASTDGTELSARGKSPYRVVDPLFWILATRGIVRTIGK